MFSILDFFSRLNEAWERASVYKTNSKAHISWMETQRCGTRTCAHTASGGSPCTPPAALPNVKTQQGRPASAERPTCGSASRHKLPADTSPAPLQASRLSVGTILATGETHLWSFLFGNL